jgi:hypothetical protein
MMRLSSTVSIAVPSIGKLQNAERSDEKDNKSQDPRYVEVADSEAENHENDETCHAERTEFFGLILCFLSPTQVLILPRSSPSSNSTPNF